MLLNNYVAADSREKIVTKTYFHVRMKDSALIIPPAFYKLLVFM